MLFPPDLHEVQCVSFNAARFLPISYALHLGRLRRARLRACSCIWACRSIERHVPCGHEGFSFSAVLATSGGGRWGPVRGCRPSEAPSALPPDDPAGLVVNLHSHGLALKGFPYALTPRGLRGFCSGSFLASLGDLPARRAMPEYAFALKGGAAKKPPCASRGFALNGGWGTSGRLRGRRRSLLVPAAPSR